MNAAKHIGGGKVRCAICVLIVAALLAAPALSEELGVVKVISLDEAVELALKNNLGLQASAYSAEAAKWEYMQSISGWLPKVYLKSSYTRTDEDTVDRANIFYESMKGTAEMFGIDESELRPSMYEDTYQTSIVAVQPITNGGAEWAGVKAGLAAKREKRAALDHDRLELIRSVKKSYYSVLQAQAMLDVAKEAMRLADESLRLAQAKYDLGQISKAELLRWRVKSAEAEGSLVEAQNAYSIAKANLAQLLGIGMDERFEVERLPDSVEPSVIESILNDIKNYKPSDGHPLLRQMSATVDLAKSERLLSYSKALPKLNFTYTYSWEADNDWQPDGYESWTATFALEVPLFQSGYSFFGIKKSYKSVAAAKSGYLESRRMLLLQALSAKRNLEAAIKKLDTSQKRLEAARETLKLARESYKVGLASQLELLDAQLAYQSARSDVVNAIASFFSAKADWEYVSAK